MSNGAYQRIYGERVVFQYMNRLHCKDNDPIDIRTQGEIQNRLNKSIHHFNFQGNIVGNAVCIIRTEISDGRINNIDPTIGIQRRDRIPRCGRIWFWSMEGGKFKARVTSGTSADRVRQTNVNSETYCFYDREHEYFGR